MAIPSEIQKPFRLLFTAQTNSGDLLDLNLFSVYALPVALR